jgi:hypothetical protein
MSSTREDGRPAFLFYVQDWLCEPTLKVVSMGSKGLWIDVLCLMARSPIKGYLLTPTGSKANLDWVAAQLGRTVEEIRPLWQELLDAGTPRTDEKGRVYSKRMVEDKSLSEKRSEAGRFGGRPKSKDKAKGKQSENGGTSLDNDNDNDNDIDIEKEVVGLYQNKVKSTAQGDTSGPQARKNVARLLREGQTPADLRQAVVNYAEFCTILGKDPEFRKNAGNFFGREAVYQEFLPQTYKKPQQPGGVEKPWRNFDTEGPRPIDPPAWLCDVMGPKKREPE